MNIAEIEKNLQNLLKAYSRESFICELLLSYGFPKSTIARLKNGTHNLSKRSDQVILKKKLLFQEVAEADLHSTIDDLRRDDKVSRYDPRFILVTDYETLLAVDTKTQDTLDIRFGELVKHFDFFLPWAGMEKASCQTENPADVKAAERMARLFDEIRKDNPNNALEYAHSLNVFLTRLLFCFFAEDTNIFEKGQFTGAISSHTQPDGSDLSSYLGKLFDVLNTDKSKRKNPPAYLDAFPYVNGGLFRDKYPCPIFTRKSRRLIIESGDLDWSAINPDIFGSMMQAVVTPEHRDGLGMHYTSVPNIMKVIEPLFLDELHEEFSKSKGSPKKLEQLLKRLRNIKIFDPACGSGNFLIIAYKELRKLEMDIFKEGQMLALSGISLSQFYGIEIDDFAHEVAKLSLWLAEHQMNVVFFKQFGRTKPSLPLQDAGHIICQNATRLDWNKVCPKGNEDEIYVLGNPPYQGSRKQSKIQKDDLEFAISSLKKYKDLDYIAAWFYKGSQYIKGTRIKLAFVSTNSICQGEQVSLLWPHIFGIGIEIYFAYTSFKWVNNAKDNAGVTVIIVGLRNATNCDKYLFTQSLKHKASNINAYLIPGDSKMFVFSKTNPLSNLPAMNYGNMPADGGKLLFSAEEMKSFVSKEPASKKWFKKLINAQEYLNGNERWCLWLEGITDKEMKSMPNVLKVVSEVKRIREASSRPQLANTPHLFAQITQPPDQNCIIVPRVSSENRKYIPIDFLDGNHKVTDSFFTIVTDQINVFAIVTSLMHMVWLKTIGGKLETRYQYSKNVVYNTFPFPSISQTQREELNKYSYMVLEERESHPEKTLAQLYDPNEMPVGLKEAHHKLDLAVERCYRSKPFENDEERMTHLFALYEKMIIDEKSKQGELLFSDTALKKKKGGRYA